MTELEKLHTDVVFGRAGGRIIWQPRIGCWYGDKKFAGEPLPAPYTGMTIPEICRALGCSHRLYPQYNRCFKHTEDSRVNFVKRELNETDTETTIETPVGNQIEITRKTDSSARRVHVKRQIETEDEMKAATWRLENGTWSWDAEKYETAHAEVADLGAATIYLPRSDVQDLYINTMGVDKAIYAIYDWPDTVNAYFTALEENHNRLIDLVCESPIDIINLGENVHSGTLSPELFEKYHLPACQRRCEKLHAAGKFVSSHWDGDCKPLLPYAKETGLDGIEAITPKPQGDVTLEEVKDALGDEMFLLDGIPAVYFDETFSEHTLVECAHKIIDLFAPRLVLGISDEISSTGDIERVRTVGRIVDEYNVRQKG